MYYRFGKVFHFFSVLFFISVFLVIYSSLSDQVAYAIDEEGMVLKQIPKETFFYFGLVLFVLLNILVVLPAKMVENQSLPSLKKLFPKGEPFLDQMLGWAYSFGAILNVSLAILAFFVDRINHQNEINSGEFMFFFYLIPVFFVVWMIALFWILAQKFKSVQVK